MTKYIIVLPRNFPGREKDSIELREAYRNMVQQMYPLREGSTNSVAAVSEATSPAGAITHIVFRNIAPNNNKDTARLLTSLIFNSENHEAYEISEVIKEDGSSVTDPRERRRDEEIFLAGDIAQKRKIENIDALRPAQELIDLVWRSR